MYQSGDISQNSRNIIIYGKYTEQSAMVLGVLPMTLNLLYLYIVSQSLIVTGVRKNLRRNESRVPGTLVDTVSLEVGLGVLVVGDVGVADEGE